jgi:phosphohistidine phosphatase
MLLYVMRHGPAEDRGPSGDFDRALSTEGQAVVRKVASELERLRDAPLRRILASPLTRAQQTAEIVRKVAGAPGVQVEARSELAAEMPATELALEMARGDLDVLLVGHQPTVEMLVKGLAAVEPGDRSLQAGFRTAMIVALRPADAGPWRIEHVIDPRAL